MCSLIKKNILLLKWPHLFLFKVFNIKIKTSFVRKEYINTSSILNYRKFISLISFIFHLNVYIYLFYFNINHFKQKLRNVLYMFFIKL